MQPTAPRLDPDLSFDPDPPLGPDPYDDLPPWSGAQLPPPPPPRPPDDAPRHRPRRRGPLVALAAATVVASGLAGYAGGRLGDSPTPTATTSSVAARSVSASNVSGTFDVQSVLASLKSSVVSVDTTLQSRRGPYVVQGQGAGTGMVLDNAGHILTNAHVIDGATTITVTLSGETQARTATLVASDTSADVAVLKVDDTKGLVPAAIAPADAAQVGDQVVAIGNALALEGGLSVTEGIVSALDRSIDTDTGSLTGLLQTDAAISSGNSGGPLVDAAGRVVGMNTAVASSSGSVQASNIGFAIPIQTAVNVADRLIGQSS
jgi:S1-C subfamily serine protease